MKKIITAILAALSISAYSDGYHDLGSDSKQSYMQLFSALYLSECGREVAARLKGKDYIWKYKTDRQYNDDVVTYQDGAIVIDGQNIEALMDDDSWRTFGYRCTVPVIWEGDEFDSGAEYGEMHIVGGVIE